MAGVVPAASLMSRAWRPGQVLTLVGLLVFLT
jgi:hypothetical protein